MVIIIINNNNQRKPWMHRYVICLFIFGYSPRQCFWTFELPNLGTFERKVQTASANSMCLQKAKNEERFTSILGTWKRKFSQLAFEIKRIWLLSILSPSHNWGIWGPMGSLSPKHHVNWWRTPRAPVTAFDLRWRPEILHQSGYDMCTWNYISTIF